MGALCHNGRLTRSADPRRAPGGPARRALAGALTACALAASLVVSVFGPTGTASAADNIADDATDLYLVTLAGPGTAGNRGPLSARDFRAAAVADQDATLAGLGSSAPVYRWTTALNGYAVRLTGTQARSLAADPTVVDVERNAVRTLAATPAASSLGAADVPGRGGAGTVIGLVDSGLWPDSPLFADVRGLGRAPRTYRGGCATAPGWGAEVCDRKIVGAHWYVEGFGADRLRTGASLSPLDDDGHGTLMASVAAGNSGVTVKIPGQRAGLYAGAAPQSRLAVYKACWTAPDPRDDGCATADLVTAIDRAVADRVDVLSLSVDGGPGIDTVERALLGAAESDIVVVAASGNAGARQYAAHGSPWVTSVGGTTGVTRRGALVGRGLRLTGAMAAREPTAPARLVLGARVPAAGATPAQSRYCLPGSLDAGRVAGRIVICERGRVGRVDKSVAVHRADGIGMVLVNVSRGQVSADFHQVPTVHLTKDDGRRLRAWLRAHPDRRVTLRPDGVDAHPRAPGRLDQPRRPHHVVPQARRRLHRGRRARRDAALDVRPPLGPRPPARRSPPPAPAASPPALLSRHDWSAAEVRSALATTAGNVAGDPSLVRLGAGRTRARAADRPGLMFRVSPDDYRAWLDGDLAAEDLNTPSLLAPRHRHDHPDGDQRRHPRRCTTRPRRAASAATRSR